MRILFVASNFSWRAGVENRPVEVQLADALRELGHEVVAVGHESRMSDEGFDICHIHHRAIASMWRVVNPRRRCPVVYTSHSYLSYLGWSTMRTAWDVREMAGVRIFTRGADGIVCLSQREREILNQRRALAGKPSMAIGNAVSRDFVVDPSRIQARPAKQPGLLFVGQLIPLKGVMGLVDAYSRLPEDLGTLSFIYHREEILAELRQRVEQLGIADRVRFLGKLDAAAVTAELLGTGALVLPSMGESLPSVVFESLMAGTPVVASDVGGIAGQVREWGRLVPPGDVDALEQAMREVLTTHWPVQRRLEMSRETAAVTDPSNVALRHVEFYERVLAGFRGR
ncbi:MAG: glycosyltransferase family 4 protein [Candidatus Nanopelagicales bacterium]